MTLARLLSAALLICAASAIAQDQQSQNSSPSALRVNTRFTKDLVIGEDFSPLSPNSSSTPAEPWRIFPDSPTTPVSGQTRPDQTPADQLKLEVRVRQLESQLDRLSEDGPTCYAIRSYVVARDAKDSDSVHPAGYSTCQPAARYGLKTTEIRSAPADR